MTESNTPNLTNGWGNIKPYFTIEASFLNGNQGGSNVCSMHSIGTMK